MNRHLTISSLVLFFLAALCLSQVGRSDGPVATRTGPKANAAVRASAEELPLDAQLAGQHEPIVSSGASAGVLQPPRLGMTRGEEGLGSKLPSVMAATVSFVSVPAVLPGGTPLATYSPLVSIQYDGLSAETYTLRVFLLETGNFFCASNQWCDIHFPINNQNGTNSSGRIVTARNMDVFDYPNFLWVADLYNQGGIKVATATQAASSTTNRAPILNQIGNKIVATGQSLDFTVSASDPEGDALSFSAQNLPPGATFNSTTGQFHWQPTAPGTYSFIGFIATQVGAVPLSDAELITIQVGSPPQPGVLAFSLDAYTTGESGPAVLTVTRTNGSAGAVTVGYATINDTAISGSDYTGVSGGTLPFADGETIKTIRVPIINDPNVEANKTFQVALSAPTGGATLGSPSSATVTIVDDDNPLAAGQWSGVATWPTVPIHMHLLPTGKVMFWDRHKDDELPMWDGTPYLWDPANPAVFTALSPPGWDLFCSGHSFMADGRLLIAGGHIADGVGALKAGVYDPFTNSWAALPNMNAGRWYPTNTTLANGDLLVVAGTRNSFTDINPLPQVWQVNSGTWRDLSSALLGAYPAWPDFYPFTYLAANGKVFVAGPQQTARYLDTNGTGTWTDVANSSLSYRDYGSSVLYDDGRVLIVGGNPREPDPNVPPAILPSATAEVINLNDPTPAWRVVAPMSVGRRHLNTTLLPDGKVLVTGGSSAAGFDEPTGAVLYAELWDPNAETWTPLAAHTRYRGYHSNALLLPDGRVLIAGGGHPNPPGGSAQNNAEIYSPPYLFRGARPVITTAPSVVTYGQTFSVQTPDAAAVTSVNWIRLPSVTHAFNQNQRLNRLSFSQTPTGLNVAAPTSANLCPPGHYMLFILDGNGVPSVAKIIQIAASSLRIDGVLPAAGRGGGGQQIKLTGSFAGLSSVLVGGVAASWVFSNGASEITVTTPPHAAGAVAIELVPAAGGTYTKPNAFAYLPTTFTDNTLVAGVTTVKAQHIIELRQAVDIMRAVAGLQPAPWTDAAPAPASTVIKALHIQELRTYLDDAASRLNYPTSPYIDPSLSAGFLIKRVHIEDLRQRIRAIAG